MTQEEKQLLLKDLCARIPYRPKGLKFYKDGVCLPDNITIIGFSGRFVDVLEAIGQVEVERVRLYLRPMSSMTEEEVKELSYKILLQPDLSVVKNYKTLDIGFTYLDKFIEWLNSHHFDYRELIPMGLALEAPEGMYK